MFKVNNIVDNLLKGTTQDVDALQASMKKAG